MAKKRKARKSGAKRATKRAAAKKAKAAPRKAKKSAKKPARKPARKKRSSAQKRVASAAPRARTEIVDVIEEIAPGVVKVTEIETVGVTLPDQDED
jgi:hypothetical protein